jgi:hypothetical protein
MATTNTNYNFHHHVIPWKKFPAEAISGFLCVIVLHALAVNLTSSSLPHNPNGIYLALACLGCLIALASLLMGETSWVRKLQATACFAANLMAMVCFY